MTWYWYVIIGLIVLVGGGTLFVFVTHATVQIFAAAIFGLGVALAFEGYQMKIKENPNEKTRR